MREVNDVIEAFGSVQSESLGNYSQSITGSGHKSTYKVSNVTSSINPKPWSSSTVGQHSYEILWTTNSVLTIDSSGVYQNKPDWVISRTWGLGADFQLYPRIAEYNETGVQARAYEKLLESVRGNHANLAVDLAEARQTVRMVAKAFKVHHLVAEFAKAVVKQRGYKKIRKGPTQGQRRLDYVNSKWLEYRYGWLPLISSIYEIGEVLKKKHTTSRVLIKGRSGQKIEIKGQPAGDGTRQYPFKEMVLQGSYRCEYGAVFDLPTGPQFSDWTSLNPASIAWELVPFSFVADWFVGVGQCLENWENWFLYRNHFVIGYKTISYSERRSTDRRGRTVYQPRYHPDGTMVDQVLTEGIQQNTFTSGKGMVRSRLLTLPTPGGPRVKVDLNSKRMLDAAALISQVVRKYR